MAEQADTEANALRMLINGWAKIDTDSVGLRVADVVEMIEDYQKRSAKLPGGYPEIRDAIVELCPARSGRFPSARSVGMRFKHLRRRVVGGRYLDVKPDHDGNFWVVRSPEGVRTPGTNGTDGTISATPRGNTNSEVISASAREGNSPVSPASPGECGHYGEFPNPQEEF